MVSPRSLRLLWGALYATTLCAADYKIADDGECDCYVINGTDAQYFRKHEFYDFRSLSDYVNVPSLLDDADENRLAPVANDYFATAEWNETWGIMNWNNSKNLGKAEDGSGGPTVLMVNSPSNVYIERNGDPEPASDTFMTLRTARMGDFQSAAEVESVPQSYHFLSVRMYARTSGAAGAITAMFTYLDSDPVQEADLEIRTMDPPDRIQYTNQPSYTRATGSDDDDDDEVAAATRNATVPAGWDVWALHRMDWAPDRVTWYVDGEQVAQIAFQTPRDPSMVIFNAWSDGGSWSGTMADGDAAYLQIQWVEMLYNSTGSKKTTDANKRAVPPSPLPRSLDDDEHLARRADDVCHNVCSIDETHKLGTPVLVHAASSRLAAAWVGGLGGMLWVTVCTMTTMGLLAV